MNKTISVVGILVLLLGLAASRAAAQHGEHGAPQQVALEQLGQVNFPVSCSADAQKNFNRAMALFHSFWFDPAKEEFGKVLNQDQECGMAHWGIAMSSMGNPFAWPANANAMKSAAAALAAAQRAGAKSERERDYIGALATFLDDWENRDHRTRVLGFEKALENLVAKYPTDDEARILYALVLDATAMATDKSFANQTKAGAMLEPLLKKYPNHPGVAHYLIHTYDYAGLAERGLPAARVYARIAPAVPHALHMPSHIFSRLGIWEEVVDSNQASYLAAKGELQKTTLGIGNYDALHAMDYIVFAYLQQSRDAKAKQVLDEAVAIRTVNVENVVAAYALAAIPARFALERGDWQQAAALKLRPAELTWSKFPQAEAILVFARGLGAARLGDVAAARQDAERLQTLKEAMAAAKMDYWVGQTDFQIKAVNAWIALAEKRDQEAIELMRAAAEAEDASDKHPVTPGNVAPCRQLLGEMLMKLDSPVQAFAEFERSLKRDQNRFRSLYGAAVAAEASGNSKAARAYYGKLQTVAANRDTERPELTKAKEFLNRNDRGEQR